MARPVSNLEEANSAWQGIKSLLDYEIKRLATMRERNSSAEDLRYQQNMVLDLIEQEQKAMQQYLALRPVQA